LRGERIARVIAASPSGIVKVRGAATNAAISEAIDAARARIEVQTMERRKR
jgi:hypothetical protein